MLLFDMKKFWWALGPFATICDWLAPCEVPETTLLLKLE